MKKEKFTLIEILGAVALIAVLLLIGIGAYTYAMDSSKEKATNATIARIENAFLQLQDKGLMKKTTGAASAVNGFVTITFDADGRKLKLGSVELTGDAFKIFARAVDADSINSILDSDQNLTDGWGQKILVRFPGKFNRGGFDIIAPGSDGTFGSTGSETTPPVDMTDYKDSDGDLVCDDIANFL